MPQIEPNHKIRGPKKVLQIYDAAFALPDDFDGTIQDAMKLFLEYHEKVTSENKKGAVVDTSRLFTPMGIIAIGKDKIKCCIEARLYELTDNGEYIEMSNHINEK